MRVARYDPMVVQPMRDELTQPMVARYGGRVELVDVQDATVRLRMSGACQGCGQADVTLRQGIEGLLTQFVPEVTGVLDITNHSAGANRSGGSRRSRPTSWTGRAPSWDSRGCSGAR